MVKVACCWDDGVVNDIRLIALLRKYNAKATFNLNPGTMPEHTAVPRWRKLDEEIWSYNGFINGKVGLAEMKEVYEDFQVASHGWAHKGGSTDIWEFYKDATDARKYLEDVFQRECRGYAWPCGDYTPWAGKILKDAGFLYGRTTQNTDKVGFTDAPMQLHPSCHHMDRLFCDKFHAAKEKNGIFYFWGHSYEMMDCDGLWDQLEQKLAMISADPEAQWIDVIDIVKR